MAKIPINLSTGTVEKNDDLIVGIDLGTTNSLVAHIENGTAKAVKDENGKRTLVPSIIHFDDSGILVGDLAKEKLITQPERTIYSVKRLMGKSYNDVNDFENYLSYKIIDQDENALVKIQVGEQFYSPIELSAEILKALKLRIENRLGQTVQKAVITVPAYFNDTQRQATRDAGKLAGLDVLRIINEPTAASLAYGIGVDPNDEKTVAVYDLGGGTFDVSILQIQQGIFEVLSTNGDTFLGGDDFDRKIIDFWINEGSVDARKFNEDKSFKQEIRLQAEEAKQALSSNDSYTNNGLSISLGQFNSLIQPLIDRTIDSCRKALSDANLTSSDISNVILVGGSTRVPLVKTAVSEFFGKTVEDKINPDEVVALGAAIQGDILAGNQKGMLLLDVTPLSLGIETVGGLMDSIIPRNNKIPAKVGRNYTTSVDGQKNLKVSVYQGERDMVEDNRKLGEFILSGIPPMPAGIPKIEIQFILDADGILVVKASELRSGIAQKIEIRSQYSLSEEEMGKMLLDSFTHAEGDLAKRALLEARNEANNVILSSKKFIDHNKNLFTKEEIEQLISMTKELEVAAKGDDKDAINSSMEKLNVYSRPLAEKALDYAISDALKGKEL
ncbi:molecular chaperone DnaK [Portibacter lacus]|uniref:Chaperone protein DnaK n=1 Tax=Portibacter lacus TaxID=1099794 RepID=A0AA37WEZ4_9BACT|nr:molecular chaperone DnaK [Portibacter lacus]GLR18298.1 chaperone protein DnaK [Portibacter lacus]